MGRNDALDGFNRRGWLDTCGGEGIMNLGQLVQLDGGIFRPLGLNQKPTHPAMASQKQTAFNRSDIARAQKKDFFSPPNSFVATFFTNCSFSVSPKSEPSFGT
jgi:hypothetical protein